MLFDPFESAVRYPYHIVRILSSNDWHLQTLFLTGTITCITSWQTRFLTYLLHSSHCQLYCRGWQGKRRLSLLNWCALIMN